MSSVVLVVAAGRGRRFGQSTPKQYVPIDGACSLRRCVETFLGVKDVSGLQVVIHPDDRRMYTEALEGLADPRILAPVLGGETRAQSVLNGLNALSGIEPSKVLVHDAARPFVSTRIIRDILAALDKDTAAFAALPIVDALWKSTAGFALEPVPRDGLWRAQTPQGFRFAELLAAHQGFVGEAADDVEIARANGIEARLIQGDPINFKITTPEDLKRAQQIVAAMKLQDSS